MMRGPLASKPLLGDIRRAMRAEKAVHIIYADEDGRESERDIWPVQLAYYEGKQIIAAWCCLRSAFRNFRTDRIATLTPTENRYGRRRAVLAREWEENWQREHSDPAGPPDAKPKL
jgi:predicted DNA-binding transcriptional regulator YafY